MVADVPQHGVQLGAPRRPPISARLTRYTRRDPSPLEAMVRLYAQYCVHMIFAPNRAVLGARRPSFPSRKARDVRRGRSSARAAVWATACRVPL